MKWCLLCRSLPSGYTYLSGSCSHLMLLLRHLANCIRSQWFRFIRFCCSAFFMETIAIILWGFHCPGGDGSVGRTWRPWQRGDVIEWAWQGITVKKVMERIWTNWKYTYFTINCRVAVRVHINEPRNNCCSEISWLYSLHLPESRIEVNSFEM